MFEVTKNGENRLDIALSGKLNSADMRIVLDDLIEASAGVRNGKMLYEIVDFHFPSLAAIAVEFSRLPSLFSLIHKFDRVAVLSDEEWIKTAGELEGMLIPGLEIKSFNRNQKAEAETWLDESVI